MTKRFALVLSAILWLALPVDAQDTRSMIFGRVLDPQSMAIVGADVIVTNLNTNTSLTIKTNETGYFEANKLLFGPVVQAFIRIRLCKASSTFFMKG